MAGILYLVPTPIGNLGDISRRSIEVLEGADFIAAEDTRVSIKLLNHLEIKKELVSYHEHNQNTMGPRILERLNNGETCALVTDAGCPGISDPGEALVALCAEAEITVCALPGPCAFVTALCGSGLPTASFCFEGFLSQNKKERRERLRFLQKETRTMLFYEAPHRLCETLAALCETFGENRRICLCRELTKLHEEYFRTTIGKAIAHYTETPPRGEFVLVVEGAAPVEEEKISLFAALEQMDALIAQGVSRKDAARQIADETGLKKKQLYDASLD